MSLFNSRITSPSNMFPSQSQPRSGIGAFSSPQRMTSASSRPPSFLHKVCPTVTTQLPMLVQKEVTFVEDTSKIEQLQQEAKELNDSKQALSSELQAMKNKSIEDTNRIIHLNKQLGDMCDNLTDLTKQSKDKDDITRAMKQDLAQATSKIKSSESENKQLRNNLITAKDQIANLTQEGAAAADSIEELNSKISNLEPELDSVKAENEYLKGQLEETIPQLENQNIKCDGLQEELNQANQNINQLQAQNSKLNEQNANQNNNIDSLETANAALASTNNQLTEANKLLTDQLQSQYNNLVNTTNENKQLQAQLQAVTGENESVKAANNVLKHSCSVARQEIEGLNGIVEKCLPEIKKHQDENIQLKFALDSTAARLQSSESELAKIQGKYYELISENDANKHALATLKSQSSIQKSELDRLNEIACRTVPELQKSQEDLSMSKLLVESLYAKLAKVEGENSNLVKELQEAKNEISSYTSSNKVLQQQNQISTNEIESLTAKVNSLTNELNKTSQDSFEKTQQISQLVPAYQQLQISNQLLSDKVAQLEKEAASQKALNNTLAQQTEADKLTLNELQAKVKSLTQNLNMKKQFIEENSKWPSMYEGSQKELRELKLNMDTIIFELKQKKQECNQLTECVSRNAQEILQKDSLIRDYEAKTAALSNQLSKMSEAQNELEKIILSMKEQLSQQLHTIAELTVKCEQYAKAVIHQEQSITAISAEKDALASQNNDLIIETEHLRSHEERLALLYKELESEKMSSLEKIRENDRLVNLVSKLEAQGKKQANSALYNSGDISHMHPNVYQSNASLSTLNPNNPNYMSNYSSNPIEGNSNNMEDRWQSTVDDVLKRSKIAVLKEDSLRNSSIIPSTPTVSSSKGGVIEKAELALKNSQQLNLAYSPISSKSKYSELLFTTPK